ncbi:uncharacterized protein F5147DRAFT_781312 [Suillus discolor]|uniref:Uncharacterized protein n=1 Tax=Suillus discolor TaxID=1912936 RepID=A0A9P7ERY8_9AGAM|nr:uncharacterized protein F5147DRAFT_781312 [Suillus discolor]KAG2087547.1 hypothetical protein F5147DRAFT_781312 [Suillus discolor]
MPPKKRARRSYEVSEATRRSERSTRGQGGHADQLKKTGETLAAPARKGRKQTTLDISDAEENPMAPSQLRKPKKNATTKRSLTGSTNPTQRSIGINKNVYSGRQQPTSGCQHSGASLQTAPSAAQSSGRFGFRQPTSTSSQNIRKPPRSNERTREEEAGNQAPEHDIGDDDQDQDQTDGENEERDRVQDQEQMLKTGDTMDFGQHEDDLDGEYEGEAQEDFNRCDFNHEPDAVDDFLNQGIDRDLDDEIDTQMDKPDAQDNAIDDDFNNELDNAARDKTEESEAFDVLERHQMKNGWRKAPSLTYLSKAKHTERRHASSHSKSPRRPSPQRVVSTGSSALARPPKYTHLSVSRLRALLPPACTLAILHAQGLHIGIQCRLIDTHLSMSCLRALLPPACTLIILHAQGLHIDVRRHLIHTYPSVPPACSLLIGVLHLGEALPPVVLTYYSDLSPYNTRERTCIISRMIRASGPWAHDKNILNYDGWAGRQIIPDGGGWAHAGNI